MHLTFTKGTGNYDHPHIARSGLPLEMIQCPKQGIIPHDMIHYAVESVVPHRGFLSLLQQGQPASFSTQGDEVADAIERLVETFQCGAGGSVPATPSHCMSMAVWPAGMRSLLYRSKRSRRYASRLMS